MLCVPLCCELSDLPYFFLFFFFNDTATTEIYTLSLHDALPISRGTACVRSCRDRPARGRRRACGGQRGVRVGPGIDRKSTRLNSSHVEISYAVFCLKKKKKKSCKSWFVEASVARRRASAGGIQ